MKNTTRKALATLGQVVHIETHTFQYVPGQDEQADAAIERALRVTSVPEDHWTKTFRGPEGLRRPSVG